MCSFRMISSALLLLLSLLGCGGGSSSPSPAPSGPASAPSGYLLLTADRLAVLRAAKEAGDPAWLALKQNVDDHLASTDEWSTGPENFALAYLLSGDARYAARAHGWAQQIMASNLRYDSYYNFGAMMQGVAMTLNYCAPALTREQAQALADYLHASTDELWYHNQGSGWGLDNPRNNYHLNFLKGTAFSGYALKAAGDVRGDAWIALLQEKLEGPEGVLPYLDEGVPGGDWEEGSNYAEGSKMHLTLALSVVAAAGGSNHFQQHPFFANLARFATYALQPGNTYLYPGGDLARDSAMPLSPYERAFIQPTTFWLQDGEGRRLGQWFLTRTLPSYLDGDRSFNHRTALYLEVLFALDLPTTNPATLPTGYRTPVTGWINARSGWDEDATSLSISGSPRIAESHQHMDTGSFVIWKGGWQSVDASTFSHSGLLMTSPAHNLLRVPHAVWITDEHLAIPGLQHYADNGTFMYAQVDATRLYRQVFSSSDIRDLLNEHTREFVYLRPNTLVVFDRVDAKADGEGYAWCLHFPGAPTQSGGRWSAQYQSGASSLVPLLGGTATAISDGDLEAGTASFRVEEAATGAVSRFLNVIEVATGTAPTTSAQLLGSAGTARGALVDGYAVLFSDGAKGAPAALPFSYTVPGSATRTHILCNLGQSVNLSTSPSGGNTLITVSAGSTHTPDAQGLVVATLP